MATITHNRYAQQRHANVTTRPSLLASVCPCDGAAVGRGAPPPPSGRTCAARTRNVPGLCGVPDTGPAATMRGVPINRFSIYHTSTLDSPATRIEYGITDPGPQPAAVETVAETAAVSATFSPLVPFRREAPLPAKISSRTKDDSDDILLRHVRQEAANSTSSIKRTDTVRFL
jgi:hypothetical protein